MKRRKFLKTYATVCAILLFAAYILGVKLGYFSNPLSYSFPHISFDFFGKNSESDVNSFGVDNSLSDSVYASHDEIRALDHPSSSISSGSYSNSRFEDGYEQGLEDAEDDADHSRYNQRLRRGNSYDKGYQYGYEEAEEDDEWEDDGGDPYDE